MSGWDAKVGEDTYDQWTGRVGHFGSHHVSSGKMHNQIDFILRRNICIRTGGIQTKKKYCLADLHQHSSTFSCVWHDGLWQRVRNYNISSNLIKVIKVLYNDSNSAALLNYSGDLNCRSASGMPPISCAVQHLLEKHHHRDDVCFPTVHNQQGTLTLMISISWEAAKKRFMTSQKN